MTNNLKKALVFVFCFFIIKMNAQELTSKCSRIETNGNVSSTIKEKVKDNSNFSIITGAGFKGGNTTANTYVRDSKPTNSSQFIQINLNIVRSDNSLLVADGIFAEFNDIYSPGVDLYDAIKFTNSNENICFLRNGISLAAERRPFINQFDTLFLNLWRTRAQNYQFEIIPDGLIATDIFIRDAYLDTITIVNSFGPTLINFAVDTNAASADINRFSFLFRKNNALPVTVTSINATAQNNTVAVQWKVENELNIAKYEVERSSNASEFFALGAVSVTENNNLLHTYKWLDQTAAQGTNFYKIKIYGRNGEIKYSSIVKVVIAKTVIPMINIYPNPVKGNIINLQLSNQPKGTYHLRLSNNIGQVIFAGSIISYSGNDTLPVDIPTNLATGIYQLEISIPGNKREIQRVMIK